MTEGPDMDIGTRAFLHREQPTFAWQPRSRAYKFQVATRRTNGSRLVAT